MKISICIPTLNRPKQLFEALCSVLQQGHNDIELVIQDGNAEHPVTDDERIQRLLSLFTTVKYEAWPNRGFSLGANRCFERSTGDILYCMGDDDWLCPGSFAAVNEVFERERYGGPCWLYGQTISASTTGRAQGIDGEATTYEKLLKHNRIGIPSVFWNRQIMELTGAFDTRFEFAPDYELWLRFWKICEPVFLNQTLGIYRHHDGQVTQRRTVELEAEAARVSQRHRNFADVALRARRVYLAKKAYGLAGIPESVN